MRHPHPANPSPLPLPGLPCPSRLQALKRYVQHNQAVVAMVPKEQLLILDIAEDGDTVWKRLCAFLGKDIPDEPFPAQNVGEFGRL